MTDRQPYRTQDDIVIDLATPETEEALKDTAAERVRQVAKWGVQSRPDGTSRSEYGARASVAKAITDRKAASGSVTWLDILTEEVMEAFESEDPDHLREELVQVAAVALSWVEDIDRKTTTARLDALQAEIHGDLS